MVEKVKYQFRTQPWHQSQAEISILPTRTQGLVELIKLDQLKATLTRRPRSHSEETCKPLRTTMLSILTYVKRMLDLMLALVPRLEV